MSFEESTKIDQLGIFRLRNTKNDELTIDIQRQRKTNDFPYRKLKALSADHNLHVDHKI